MPREKKKKKKSKLRSRSKLSTLQLRQRTIIGNASQHALMQRFTLQALSISQQQTFFNVDRRRCTSDTRRVDSVNRIVTL
jgi:hypothetical protein